FDETGHVDSLREQDINTFVDPVTVDFIAGTAEDVSYAVVPDGALDDAKMFVPLFTSSQTAGFGAVVESDAERDAFVYDRWLAIGPGDVGGTLDAYLETTGITSGGVDGHVVETGTGLAVSDVHVLVYEGSTCDGGPWSEWLTDVGDDPHHDGSFGGLLPPGEWSLLVHGEGRPDSACVPITVEAGGTRAVVLDSPRPASIHFQVVDETGRYVPAKVTFFTVDGSDVRDPVKGDGFISGSEDGPFPGHPAQVNFAPYGWGEIVLPPGDYYAVASRGIEYEIDVTQSFTVRDDTTVDLQMQVVRTVDTSGWISADFHVHAEPSFDSGTTLADRVKTMTAEGVEFFSSTDHDAISDYRPVIEEMGMEPWISSTPGLEVTTLEVGHVRGFPLAIDPLADQAGALDWTGLRPNEIIEGLRDLGAPNTVDPVVFVGHPRDGIIGYFDQYGLDPYSGTPGAPTSEPSWATAL
ncbi:MAG: hypothetical protein QGG40_11515, partial [Myxococcota bacterium]|nr:hypothetical protein [Myxococcota bacterium]